MLNREAHLSPAVQSGKSVRAELNAAEIRCALAGWLRRHHSEGTTEIVSEIGIRAGSVLIDVAVINGEFQGFEIKSDRDTLRRLPTQVRVYSEVLDRATLVVGNKHERGALNLIPRWWGIARASPVDQGVSIEVIRESERNPQPILRALVELLWLEDAKRLLERKSALGGLRGKPRAMLWDRLCEVYAPDVLSEEVRQHLKGRAKSGVLQRLS